MEQDETLHVADPAHQDRATPDPVPVWDAPEGMPDTPAWMADYPDMAWLVAETPGLVLDATPMTHHEGYTAEALPTELDAVRASGAAHGQDYGGSRQANFAVPGFQSADERYLAPRFESAGAYEPSPVALQRGLNALGQNNPPLESYGGKGFRYGWVEQNWVDRKMYVGERVHDRRLVQPNTATVVANQPAHGADSTPYNSPFDLLARAIPQVGSRPLLRREPPSIIESEITDAAGAVDLPSMDWVAG